MRGLALAAALLLAVPAPARAAEWGTIVPGASTMETVRGQYGGPTKTETQKVDNYDTTSWLYEGAQAPAGLQRLVVDFGILQAGGFRRDVVRAFKLEPKPGVFNRTIVLAGWGRPDRVGKEGEGEAFFYTAGLLVIFDKEGWSAQLMVFTPPQPEEPGRPPR